MQHRRLLKVYHSCWRLPHPDVQAYPPLSSLDVLSQHDFRTGMAFLRLVWSISERSQSYPTNSIHGDVLCTLHIARHSPRQWCATWTCHFCWICQNMCQGWQDSIEPQRFLNALRFLKHNRHDPSAAGNNMAHLDGRWGEWDSFPTYLE